jgi:hypothetical protein
VEPRENVLYVHPDSVPAGGNKVLVINAITGRVKNRDNYFPHFFTSCYGFCATYFDIFPSETRMDDISSLPQYG